jgi:hypothetical protein
MEYLEGYFWATCEGQRRIYLAIGSDYEGGEQNFQCVRGGDVVKRSELSNLVSCEEEN